MAARVNVKFVVILSVALVGIMAAVVWAAATVVLKSGEDHAARARELEAVGDWKAARGSWGQAVSHDRTRLEWLEGWRNAMERVEHESDAEYISARRMHQNMLRATSEVKGADLASHTEFLEQLTLAARTISRVRPEEFSFIVNEVDRSLSFFPEDDTANRGKIRRFRGIIGARMLSQGGEVDDSDVEAIRDDLVAALDSDPSDVEALVSLAQLDAGRADEARRARREADAETIQDSISERVASFVQTNPDSLRARVLQVRIELNKATSEIQKLGLFGSDLVEAQIEAITGFSEQANDITDDFLQAGADQADYLTATEIASLLRFVEQGQANDRVLEIWDHARDLRPDDLLVLQSRGNFLKSINRFQEAIETFRGITELKRPPISAEGEMLMLLRRFARREMSSCAYEQFRTRTVSAARLQEGSEERKAMLESAQLALENAEKYRELAGQDLAEDDVDLVLLDAKLAFANSDTAGADRLVRRFNEATGDRNAEGLKLAADIARALGNVGEQQRLLERAHSVAPQDVLTLLDLAQVKLDLRDYEEAERLFRLARDRQPGVEFIEERLQMVQALLGTSESDNPIQSALIQAQLAMDSGDRQEAIRVLESEINSNPDLDSIELHLALGNIYRDNGSIEKLAEIAEAGLEISPDSRALQMLLRQAEVGNDIDAADAAIDSIQVPEHERNLRKYRIRVSTGRIDEARPFIDEARELAPDNKEIALAAFEYALMTEDLDTAREIIAQQGDRDIDGADGLTLRARLDIAEGKLDEAERALAAAVDRGSLNPDTLRLLGQVRQLSGDTLGALDSFRRARDARPNDARIVVGYARALAAAGRNTDALAAMRSSLQMSRNNAEFRGLWLALEAIAGSKQTAYNERVNIAENDPDNQDNNASLISLCLDLRKLDEARERLDKARAENDNLQLCSLDAKWHLQRGDLQGAAAEYSEFLLSDADGASSPNAYITFGSFLIEQGQIESGLTTLRQGRRLQSQDNPIVDRVLAQKLFSVRRYEEAARVLEGVLDGPAAETDAGAQSVGLLIESYIRMHEWDAADARMSQLDQDTRDELVMRLLRVEIAKGRGDSTTARFELDETITAYPNAPLPYVRRATMLMADQTLLNDAVEDLTRAIELDPTNADAFRFRSMCYSRLDRAGDAAADIIQAARAKPNDDRLRLDAANQLITLGREDQAADVIDEGLARQAGNLRLMTGAATLFQGIDRHRRAIQYLTPAWEQTKDIGIASSLVTSMLELPSPDVRAARQLATDASLDQEDARVIMIRANIESKANNTSATSDLLTQAYGKIKNDPQSLLFWAGQLSELLGGREQALEFLSRTDARETLSPWARFARARILSEEDSGNSQAIEILRRLIDGSQDRNLQLASIRLRSIISYQSKDYQRAVDDMRRGLEIAPDDAELNNNLAYVLAVNLDQADAAIPFAIRAVEAAPDNRGFLDTLGTTYVSAGQPEKAIAPLERALTLSATDVDRAPVLVHLARARLETENYPGAEDAASEARAIIESLDDPDETIQAELQSVLDDIKNAR